MLKTIVQNQLSEKVSIVQILSQSWSTCCTCPFEEEAQRVSEVGKEVTRSRDARTGKGKGNPVLTLQISPDFLESV